MVSIIIPVYNVEDYIDRCMESVVNQTYKDIEILVMEARSTDDSLKKVIEWAKNDKRITIVSRYDGGLGPGRNYGINIARGDYLLFVDSDDWISYDFVEKTLQIAESDKEIDFVQADVIIYEGEKPRNKKKVDQDIIYEGIESKKFLMCYGDNSMWGKLYKTKLFKENDISQPALPFEDLAVYPAIIAASRKIATCYAATAYYQAEREGSLFQNVDSYKKLPMVMKWAKDNLIRLEYYDTYSKVFQFMMYRHFRNTIVHYIGEERYLKLENESQEIYKFQCQEFSKYQNITYWAFGSFSLRWIAHRFVNGKDGLKKHFTFTSIISAMTKGRDDKEVVHENLFRENCLKDDMIGGFSTFLEKHDFKSYPMFIVIDFLQECRNIYFLKDGNYITETEALLESSFSKENVEKIILWESKEFWQLWKEKCTLFIKKMESVFKDTEIVLVENRFSDSYIVNGEKKKYLQDISNMNFMIDKMYKYFLDNCKKCIFVDCETNLLYTDTINQPYDSSPEYLNSLYYAIMAKKIELAVITSE